MDNINNEKWIFNPLISVTSSELRDLLLLIKIINKNIIKRLIKITFNGFNNNISYAWFK
jgi:hypothetical protein